MSIGRRIRSAREGAGLTQGELGSLCGTTKQTIFKYENDIVTNIPPKRVIALADALHTTPAYLMGWDDALSEMEASGVTILHLAAEFGMPPEAIQQSLSSPEFLSRLVRAATCISREFRERADKTEAPAPEGAEAVPNFDKLSPENQAKALEYIELLLNSQRND